MPLAEDCSRSVNCPVARCVDAVYTVALMFASEPDGSRQVRTFVLLVPATPVTMVLIDESTWHANSQMIVDEPLNACPSASVPTVLQRPLIPSESGIGNTHGYRTSPIVVVTDVADRV